MQIRTIIILIMLQCIISLNIGAAMVHRWVNRDGVTYFSDTAPADGATDPIEFEIKTHSPAPVNAETNYYSIANQWKRLREERAAKTALSLEKARIRTQQTAASAKTRSVPAAPEYAPRPPGNALAYGYNRIVGFVRQPTTVGDPRHHRSPHHVQAGHGHIAGASQSSNQRIISHAGGRRGAHLRMSFGDSGLSSSLNLR